jgi:hypothetical protein
MVCTSLFKRNMLYYLAGFSDEACFIVCHFMIPPSTTHDDRVWAAQQWAARLQRWGLDEIAPVLVEALRPLGPIGSQLLTIASPLLTTFVDRQRLDHWIEVLDDPDQLEQFARALDREADQ